MILAKEFELILNLSQFNYNGKYYDFHNDYHLDEISFEHKILKLRFRHIVNGSEIVLNFFDVVIEKFNVFGNSPDSLTLDTLYRGRFQKANELIEFDDERGFFYLEKYSGDLVEFWSSGLLLEIK